VSLQNDLPDGASKTAELAAEIGVGVESGGHARRLMKEPPA
jgi:hypothetical protein